MGSVPIVCKVRQERTRMDNTVFGIVDALGKGPAKLLKVIETIRNATAQGEGLRDLSMLEEFLHIVIAAQAHTDITVADIKSATGRDNSSVNQRVVKLEDVHGLIARLNSHGREKPLMLTRKGARLAADIDNALRSA